MLTRFSLADIAEYINGEVAGDPGFTITAIATLQSAKSDQLSFISNLKYKKFLLSTHAGAVIVDRKTADFFPGHKIIVDDVYVAYAKATAMIYPKKTIQGRLVSPTAIISPDVSLPIDVYIGENVKISKGASIGEQVSIATGAVIGENVTIGNNTIIRNNVVLCNDIQIGSNCIIHPGVIIGADGFGMANENGKWLKIAQVGSVVIHDSVEVGANTTIDRGALDDTVIGQGTKIDNQVQIGHNVHIGEHSVIAGCTGISGSTRIGHHCVIGGGVGIAGHLTITDNVILTGMSMVTKSINQPGSYSSGIPIESTQEWRKKTTLYRQLVKLVQRVKLLENKNSS